MRIKIGMRDPRRKSLNQRGNFVVGQDLNLRPSGYEPESQVIERSSITSDSRIQSRSGAQRTCAEPLLLMETLIITIRPALLARNENSYYSLTHSNHG